MSTIKKISPSSSVICIIFVEFFFQEHEKELFLLQMLDVYK